MDDLQAVTGQIGRPPRGNWSVARRCACQLPQVVQTEPVLSDGTPFPTLWWLTCKKLNSAVGRLEAQGWMASLNQRLSRDPELAEKLKASIQGYVSVRNRLTVIESRGHPGGGPERVKCLHAHVAHHLMTGDNPVGALALGALDWTEPSDPCVA